MGVYVVCGRINIQNVALNMGALSVERLIDRGLVFFFKQKTAYEIKECDWSSDVCSSDLILFITVLLRHTSLFSQIIVLVRSSKEMSE